MATMKKVLPKVKSGGGAPKKAMGGKVIAKKSMGGKMKKGC